MPTTENRGHVTIRDDNGAVIATVLDMGGTCAIHSEIGDYTPDQAYDLGCAVLQWACRKRVEARGGRRG
jgi:hypothetical protein